MADVYQLALEAAAAYGAQYPVAMGSLMRNMQAAHSEPESVQIMQAHMKKLEDLKIEMEAACWWLRHTPQDTRTLAPTAQAL